jgi:hypothetical protein
MEDPFVKWRDCSLYGDRIRQLDVGVNKILRFGPTRRSAWDVSDALNSDVTLGCIETGVPRGCSPIPSFALATVMAPLLALGADGLCRSVVPDGTSAGTRALAISSAVGRNASNQFEDVRTVQDALNQVPPGEGGPIEKLNVDGLCWGKTTAAIERFQRKACRFKWPDGRVDPEGKTHRRLRDFFLLPSPYVLMSVHLVLPQARSWIFWARTAVQTARRHLDVGISSREVLLLDKYFHLDRLSKPGSRDALTFIDALYRTMEDTLSHSVPDTAGGAGYFAEDPKGNLHYAYTYPGGLRSGPMLSRTDGPYTKGPDARMDRIYVCPRKALALSHEVYTVVVVHELAHFCGQPGGHKDSIGDHGYRRKPGFFDLPPDKAIRTADCYAHFAGHLAMNREPQYV